MDQTEITVFRNGASLRRYEHWFYRGTQINITSEYKYLGILLTSCLSWSSAHSKLVSQAQRARFAIKAYQKPFGYFSAVDSFKIFYSMVKPILCYAFQIWGYEYVDTIESVHNRFCKNILYVRSTTDTCMVLGECGR